MGGVDNVDRQVFITETVGKTMIRYRKLFTHLYKMKNAGPASIPEFRLEVARVLLNCVSESIPLNVKQKKYCCINILA